MLRLVACCLGLCLSSVGGLSAVGAEPSFWVDDFSETIARWERLDPECWEHRSESGNGLLSLHRKASSYTPPHRSPHHVALLKEPTVGDFELTVRIRSTHPDYGHRDACLFFGWQDPAHFYYVHLGKKTDPRCNQIFVVKGADRSKLSNTTNAGTPWDDAWHTVRIVRNTSTGQIEVYWDNAEQPVMTATDTSFTWGQIGVGSFDDTADFDDVRLVGVEVTNE